MDDQPKRPIEQIPVRDLKMEPGAEELLESSAMKPYVKLAVAVMGHKDPGPAVEEIASLPLEQRYTWRVASALKWAFADFDNLCVEIDRDTLSPEDREKVLEVLRHRPIQFCIFLKALLGKEEMQRMMLQGIKTANQLP